MTSGNSDNSFADMPFMTSRKDYEGKPLGGGYQRPSTNFHAVKETENGGWKSVSSDPSIFLQILAVPRLALFFKLLSRFLETSASI